MAQPDLDHTVVVTDPVTAGDAGTFRLDRPISKAKLRRDPSRISIEARRKRAPRRLIHPHPEFVGELLRQ